MDRRRFLLTSLAGALAAPLAAEAQEAGKVYRVAVLTPFSLRDSRRDGPAQGFFDEVRKLGWIEGQNFVYDWPDSHGNPEHLRPLAEELARRTPDVILACGLPAARAAQSVTSTIPVVFACSVPDPVGDRLVQTLSRPGGNLTGLADGSLERYPKMLQLVVESMPRAKIIALVGRQESGSFLPRTLEAMHSAGRSLGAQVVFVPIERIEKTEGTFAEARRKGARGAIVYQDAVTHAALADVVSAALRQGLPIVGGDRRWAEAGALMSFAADWWMMLRRQAHFMDKILKGAKPADLPVEQPTKFDLIVNLKTAKALGVTIPPSLLLRADQIIE